MMNESILGVALAIAFFGAAFVVMGATGLLIYLIWKCSCRIIITVAYYLKHNLLYRRVKIRHTKKHERN